MSEPAKDGRQDPELKKELGDRFSHIVEKSGLDPSVISFRCGWKTRTRIKNYMTGYRTPGAQELIEFDKVMFPIFGENVSTYILYGKFASEMENSSVEAPALNQAAVNRAFVNMFNDYVEMRRLIPEPKLTTSKMLDEFNDFYLPRELKNGNQQAN